MEMRQRRTFKEVTVDIMSNVSAFLEAMAAPPPRAEPKGKAKPQPPTRRELDTAVADPPPLPRLRSSKGEKGKKGRKGEGKGRKGGGQTKGADKRQDAQWASWSDSSWDGAGAWWSGRPGRAAVAKPRNRAENARASGRRGGSGTRPVLCQTPAPHHQPPSRAGHHTVVAVRRWGPPPT